MEDTVDPIAARACAEKLELIRICAVSVMQEAKAGHAVDPHRMAWAKQVIATTPPLRGALGTGEPIAPARAFAGSNGPVEPAPQGSARTGG